MKIQKNFLKNFEKIKMFSKKLFIKTAIQSAFSIFGHLLLDNCSFLFAVFKKI